MSIHYDQIGQVCATFRNPHNISVGVPCKMASSDTIDGCEEADDFIGIITSKRGEFATVILRGFVTLPYSMSTPVCGFCCLGGNDDGTIGSHGGCKEYLVTAVDSTAKTVTFLL